MEQCGADETPSGAETLEHETGVKPPKWNSRRATAAAADEIRGRVAETTAAARQETGRRPREFLTRTKSSG